MNLAHLVPDPGAAYVVGGLVILALVAFLIATRRAADVGPDPIISEYDQPRAEPEDMARRRSF